MARTKAKKRDSGAAPVGKGGDAPNAVPAIYRAYYDLGRRVAERLPKESSSKRTALREKLPPERQSRRAALRAVARETGESTSTVKYAHNCVKRLSVKQLVRLAGMETRSGKPPSWSHLRRLAMVGGAKPRRELIAGIERHGWTSDELAEEIKRRKGETAGTGGRKLTRPGTLSAGLKQVDVHCREWLKHHDALWSAEQSEWLSVSKGEDEAGALQERLEEVKVVKARVRQLALAALGLEDRLGRVEDELRPKG